MNLKEHKPEYVTGHGSLPAYSDTNPVSAKVKHFLGEKSHVAP